MRDLYHEELDSVGRTLVEMTNLVACALDEATAALLTPDLHAAESVVAADHTIDAAQDDLNTRVLDLIARQQPVAGDLRTLVTSLRMSADLERMGDLARHIAKVARLRHPHRAVPEELRETVAAMGQLGTELARKVGHVIEDRDADAARTLDAGDDKIDQLHRALFTALL
jgi:phosphate transport system protein